MKDETEGLDFDTELARISDDLNKISARITQRYTLRYYVLIYRLLKRGYVKMDHLAECVGVEARAIYRYIDRVEELLQEKKLSGV